MATEVNKTELQTISGDLASKIATLKSDMDAMKTVLDGAADYDGIDVTGPARIIKNNLDVIIQDMEAVSTNITNYANAIAEFDMDDFTESIFSQDIIKEEEVVTEPLTEVTTEATTEAATKAWTVGSSNSGASSNSGSSSYYSGYSNSTPSSGSSSNANSTGTSDFFTMSGAIAGATTENSYGIWDPSEYVGDSKDINGSMLVTPNGKTSADGRTQRSASKSFTIKAGVVDDPNLDISKYHSNVKNGFEVTTGNLTYDLCDEDIELLCAIVAAESDQSYDDALAVISTVLNRCETSNWINCHGRDPIAQVTAPNQYSAYQLGLYEKYMDGNAPDAVQQAVADALAGVRNHNYTSFRSNVSAEYSDNTITETGNRYM